MRHWPDRVLIRVCVLAGLIITNSNRTMIVSSATKENAGYFHCSATNLLGETISDRHQIDILCKWVRSGLASIGFVSTGAHRAIINSCMTIARLNS